MFHLKVTKTFFTLLMAEHWNRLPREVMGVFLSGDIQNSAGCAPVYAAPGDCFGGGMGCMISRGSFQPQQICDWEN